MKRPIALLAAISLGGPAFADAGADLAQKKSCMACHAIDKKLVGPAFKEVAVMYAGQSDAAARLSQAVLKGSSGAWGSVPMPANPQVSAAEARQLVLWVLQQK